MREQAGSHLGALRVHGSVGILERLAGSDQERVFQPGLTYWATCAGLKTDPPGAGPSGRVQTLAPFESQVEEEQVVGVQRWGEIRRMKEVEGLSIHEIRRRTGCHRDTIRRALASKEPPRYSRAPQPSKLDPFKEEIRRLLKVDPRILSTRVRELIARLGYEGGKTICDDYVREVRPFFAVPRTYQRTSYRPGELFRFGLFEPRSEIPVGKGQTRRGFVVTCASGYSRASAGALVFSKEVPDILWGMARCLRVLGALPEKLVWDREGAIHAGGGRPTDPFAAFCGELCVGWAILAPADAEAKRLLKRIHRFMRTSFEPGREFASPDDYQAQLGRWFSECANTRRHRAIGASPAERLAEEREAMRPLPERMPKTERRWVMHVPSQPYFRFDRNDYSLDPRLVGRRVEVRAGQRAIVAIALDSAQVAARHRRSFAREQTITDPAHQRMLEALRVLRLRRGADCRG